MDKNILRAVEWLKNSGIQNTEGTDIGGFNGWYDIDKNSYPFVYSEITGYGITALLYANKIKPDPLLIERSKLAAAWISAKALHKAGGIRARAYNYNPDKHFSFENNVLYIFDSGMVLAGLVNLFSMTKDESVLKTAKIVADFLLDMQKEDGMFYSAYDANNDERIDTQDKWSTQSGSYHAKLAIGLSDLYTHTGDDAYYESASNICQASLKLQQNAGNFITQKAEKSTHMHPNCYTAEGLAYFGLKSGNRELISSAVRSIKWALENQLPTGGIPCKFADNSFNTNERSDTLAQTLRLAVFFKQIGLLEGYETNVENLASRLLSYQKTGSSHDGGFFYGVELDGTRRNHVNSWCSMFALQALDMFKNGRSSLDMLV